MKPVAANKSSKGTAKARLLTLREGQVSMSGSVLVELLQAVLEKGAQFRFRAKGASMCPFIKDGDVVTISPFAISSPCVGDVVAFVRPDTQKLVIHRVVGKRGHTFLIKGDNIHVADETVPCANILGRVTKLERDGRKVYLGLGLERFLIAFLTRQRLLYLLLLALWRFIRPIIRRSTE